MKTVRASSPPRLIRNNPRTIAGAAMKAITSAWMIEIRSVGISATLCIFVAPLRNTPRTAAQHAEQEGGRDDARRMALAQQRQSDCVEAQTAADAAGHRAVHAEHLVRTCQPRQRARKAHRQNEIARDVHARVLCRIGVGADRADLETDRGAEEQPPHAEGHGQRDEEADMEPGRLRQQPRQAQATAAAVLRSVRSKG